jgi:integrase/recombinase XerD
VSNLQLTRNRTRTSSLRDAPDLESINYYIDGFLLKHRSQRHSPKTIRFYAECLRRFLWFLEHEDYPIALQEITPNHIRHFLIYISECNKERWGSTRPGANRPLSPASIHAFARTLRAFFRWVTKEAQLQYNPFSNVDMPKLPNQWKVEVYTEDEIARIFSACDQGDSPFYAQRNRAIVSLLLDSGIRASELLGLEVDDIDPRQGVFTVHGKGNKDRTAVIGQFARRALWEYLTHHRLKLDTFSPALFVTHQGTPLSYDGLRHMLSNLGERGGIERLSVRCHRFRHSFATMAHRNGMRGSTLQEALGHTTWDVTRKFYINISKEDLIEEHARYAPLDRMSRQLKAQQPSALRPSAGPGASPNRHPKLPDAKVLAREVSESTFVAVARKYGVSDVCIHKRLRKAGLK